MDYLKEAQMLKPFYQTLEESFNDAKIVFERSKVLRSQLESEWPEDLEANVSFSDLGASRIRAFIYLSPSSSEADSHKAVASVCRNFGEGKKFFRADEGKFAWQFKKKDDECEYLIFIENASKGQCQIVEEEVMVKRFKSICPGQEEAQA